MDSANRRIFRFSLRTMLVIVTLICVCAGILGGWASSARRQRQAVEAIRQFGFIQSYDINEPDLNQPRLRRWLHRWLDDDYFRNVDRVQGCDSQRVRRMTDADLPLLTAFPQLKYVQLYGTDVSTDGFKAFQSFKRLESLTINSPIKGDGEGLHDLAGCKSLRHLHVSGVARPHDGLGFLRSMPFLTGFGLSGMRLDENDFQCIGSLRGLRSLTLTDVPLTPAGLSFMQSLGELRSLDLHDAKLKADDFRRIGQLHELRMLLLGGVARPMEGLGFLGGVSKLTWLDVSGMKLDDTDFQQIARLERLIAVELVGASFRNESLGRLKPLPDFVKLVLPETAIDDRAVDILCKFPHLTELDIRKTKITAEGAAILHEKLHGCQIRHESLPDPYNIIW